MRDNGRTAAAWLEVQRNWWAVEEIDRLCGDDPDAAWAVVLEILDQADEEDAGRLGAGPLEDLIDEHGAHLIDRIEAEAARSPRLAEALRSVWLRGPTSGPAERFLRLGCQPDPRGDG